MKKIAIVGANSYIARNIIYTINNMYKECELYLYGQADAQIDGQSTYTSINILDLESVEQINFECDIIFMFIGKTGTINGFDNFDTFIDINERALLNLLNAYRSAKSKAKIVFPSTRLVYKGKTGPQKEDAEKEFKTIYAINKYACENYLEQYHNIFNVQYCIFRICIPYGTLVLGASSYGTAEFMLNKAKKGENISLYGDGMVRRTLTYIGDLCRILIDGAMSEKCVNDVFNIGGENYSLKEMAELLASQYNVGIDYVPYPELALKIESGDTVFDDEKLRNHCQLEYRMNFKNWCSGIGTLSRIQ